MDLAQQAKIVDSIHDTLNGFVGQRLHVKANMGRSKIIESEGVLSRETISYYAVSLGRKFGAAKVSLFGSYARNEATADSDIDILLDKGSIRGMQVLDFQEELSKKLGKKVDVVTTAGASERFLRKISKDETVLYEAG